ncbi:DUF397 domain-containing protein [Streptomyces sp. SID3343]|uniref:DUF397 domain-containing protein n=1 Tax=Streptomyces sp. SID3343 TaxID=2690260 RepID=UPI00136FC29D|nr:DUF397 domain-containing protein [Streptomyces sp. SID3343]MYW02330.1 DUF397 domain-containing protein [Streptomyces sp. SID3343]
MNDSSNATARSGWRKSTYSANADNCVETLPLAETMEVRDSKEIARGSVAVPGNSWTALTRALKG